MADERPMGTSGLGIAALVMGIVALLGCWIPLIGLLTIPIAGLGGLLAIIGLLISALGRRSSVGMPFAGLITCGLAMLVAMSMTAALANAVAEAARERSRRNIIIPPDKPLPAASIPNEPALPPTPATAENPEPPKATPTTSAKPKEPAPLPAGENTSRNVPPASNKADAALPADETSADKAILAGDIRIVVDKVESGLVPLVSVIDGETKSADSLLMIHLSIRNLSKVKKHDYQPWAGELIATAGKVARLTDDHGNTYKRIGFGIADKVAGQLKSNESIYPSRSISDVLVFEPPIDAASYLVLELPAENIGGEGALKFRIPAMMYQPPIFKSTGAPVDKLPQKPNADEKKWRTWTSGTHTLDAKFDGMIDRVVKLKRRDGSFVKVPLEKLSDDDQEFILKRKWGD